jgi:hypothetical protein
VAFSIGTQVKVIGLPVDHQARCNADHAVVIGVTFYLGRTLYALKTHTGAQGIFFPVDGVNVAAATNPTPPLGIAGVVAWNGPAHHSLTP